MPTTLIYILIGLVAVMLVMIIIMMASNTALTKKVNDVAHNYQVVQKQLDDINNDDQEMVKTVQNSFNVFSEMLSRNQKDNSDAMSQQMKANNDAMSQQMKANNDAMAQQMKANSEAMDRQMKASNDVMDKKLSEMYTRLEEMHKSLGEMQSLAGGVDDLKKVLSNVKTRGILGEVQLKAILEQILSPEQYEENISTVPSSSERVEFAVKLPGDDDKPVYLPIDSKFPGERYAQLRDAYETGDKALIDAAWKALETVIKLEAKDIQTKYIMPPYTTDFGIMFLPFEGLYAEVINHGMLEVLQRDYKVNIAGPTTMAALLNSLQMGFKTLAIQKHSGEVWEILGAVKTEFANYSGVLSKARDRIRQTDEELDKLVGTRTRAIERKLRSVEALSSGEANDILELQEFSDIE